MKRTMFDKICRVNKDNLNTPAIYYMGRNITYKELFLKANRYAMSLYSLGYRAGSEILACVSSMPEYIFLILASIKLGCRLHPVKEEFSYLYLKELIDQNEQGYIFLSDDKLLKFKYVIDRCERIKGAVVFSLDSSINIIRYERYLQFLRKVGRNLVCLNPRTLSQDNPFLEVFDASSFVDLGSEYVEEYMGFDSAKHHNYAMNYMLPMEELDDDTPIFTTYLSDEPEIYGYKTVDHTRRDLMFLEDESKDFKHVQGKKLLAYVPNHVFAHIEYILSSLYMGTTLICEPVFKKELFPHIVYNTGANIVIANNQFWKELFLKMHENSNLKEEICGNLGFPFFSDIASNGEKKLFNSVAQKDFFIRPYPIMSLSHYYRLSNNDEPCVTLKDGTCFPLKVISRTVEKDEKYILSSIVVKTQDEFEDEKIVIYVEYQPLWWEGKNTLEVLKDAVIRLDSVIPEELKNKIYMRPIFPHEPLDRFYNFSGRKDINRCANMELDDRCIPYTEIREEVVYDAKTFMLLPKNK